MVIKPPPPPTLQIMSTPHVGKLHISSLLFARHTKMYINTGHPQWIADSQTCDYSRHAIKDLFVLAV